MHEGRDLRWGVGATFIGALDGGSPMSCVGFDKWQGPLLLP